MQTFLYIIWGLLVLFFFGFALWAKLEQVSGSAKKQNPGDFAKQGLFVLGCVLVSVLIDQYLLEDFVLMFSPSFVPLGFYQVMLLPVVLLIGAHVVGGSKDIKVTRAPGGRHSKQQGSKKQGGKHRR